MSLSPRGRAPVYQIDFMAVQSGKRIASTKRRIRWRFGFANTEALAAGETGTNCRGEEHDITLVWSLTSGKRMIIADGQEVHYSNSRSNIFDFSWTMKGNSILKVVAHASPPLSPTPGFRQYEFFVNGQSFFSFPKVFRLGMMTNATNDPRGDQSSPLSGPPRVAESSKRYNRSASGSVHGIASIEAPGNPDEEEMYLQEAIRQSLQDDAKAAAEAPAAAAAAPTGDLLDLGSPGPVPAPANAFAGALVAAPSSGYYGGAVANPYALAATTTTTGGHPYGSGPPVYGAPASANPYGAPPPAAANPYGAPPQNPYGAPFQDPFAKPPPDTVGAANPYAVGPFDASQSAASVNLYAVPPSNPYAPATTAAPANPYPAPAPNAYATAAPAASNPYATDSFAGPTLAGNPYGTAPAPTNPYGSAPPAPVAANNNPYASSALNGGGPEQYKQPELSFDNHYSSSNPYSTPGADMKTNGRHMMMMNGGDVPPDVNTPRNDQTPSSLGFGSPPADFSGFSPSPGEPPKPADAITGSKADQAYFKLANLDTFSIASKKDEERLNPFESRSITETRSLADIAKAKPKSNVEIMKSHAVVVSNNPSSYASQYGIAPQAPMSQPQHPYGQQQTPLYGQQQTIYGQQQQQQQPQYGQQQPPQSSYGIQNGGYGVGQQPPAPYGQAAPYGGPPQQQQPPAYGQPSPQPAFGQPSPQQPPAAFSQPPPMMQQYGGAPQYGPTAQQQFGNMGY